MRALVTGVTGQDGLCLATQLAADGHEVYGLVRWVSSTKRDHVQRVIPGIHLLNGDLTDQMSLVRALDTSCPDVVFNLAALASSGQSWAQPLTITEINALGVLKLLEAIREVNLDIRLVQASTSEQYGVAPASPQTRETPFAPLNVYGIAKTFAHQAVVNYRDSFGMHASTVLMHNHLGYTRSAYFVDRKITRTVARIARGVETELRLGNTEASRDFGWGPEFMEAWPLVSQRDVPDDYILATGESHTVQEMVELAFDVAGLDWRKYVVRDPALTRPTDVPELRGDPSYTTETLGWTSRTTFHKIVEMMVRHDFDTRA